MIPEKFAQWSRELPAGKVEIAFEMRTPMEIAAPAEVKFWINGKLRGSHVGGYLPCVIDVSEAVNYGGENLISVWVDTSKDLFYRGLIFLGIFRAILTQL